MMSKTVNVGGGRVKIVKICLNLRDQQLKIITLHIDCYEQSVEI